MNVFGFASSILLLNAFLLGIRHGLDWDHLAAIGDIVGASSVSGTNTAGGAAASTAAASTGRSLYLTFLYAMGHSLVVIALSIGAIAFASEIPECIRQSMEVVVGISLLIFGVAVAVSVGRAARGHDFIPLYSRWMVVLSALRLAWHWCLSKCPGLKHRRAQPISFNQYGATGALGIGMLHGIGAETASQLMIIATVGSSSHQLAMVLLLAFVLGFIVSNAGIAALFSAGILTAVSSRPLHWTIGILASIFSITVGVLYIIGNADRLPPLQQIWGDYGG